MINAIIQCRMSSKRFPGKVLSPFMGKPLLLNVVNRLRKTKIKSSIILATSNEILDEPLVVYAKKIGIDVVRGPRDDVVKRYILALKKHKCEAFFRICGDSPLLFPNLFDYAISIYNKEKENVDLVSNVFPKTFPPGMSVELIKSSTFIKNNKNIVKKIDREHVTKYFYDNSKKFQIFNINCDKYVNPNLELTVDEIKDLRNLETWYLKKGERYMKLFPIKFSKMLIK